MSYDLMVFEKSKAPTNKEDFMKWYEKQVQWSEDHSYQASSVSSVALQNWFMEMKDIFYPMNGEFAVSDDLIDDPHVTDYCIGCDVIYTAFAWSLQEEAYTTMLKLAKKHNVGFFDVSGNEEIIF